MLAMELHDMANTMMSAFPCCCENPNMEQCPQHTPVERMEKLLARPSTPLYESDTWQEVTCAPKEITEHLVFTVEAEPVAFLESYLPAIFVVRGSQMFKLKWPELPPRDPKKGPGR